MTRVLCDTVRGTMTLVLCDNFRGTITPVFYGSVVLFFYYCWWRTVIFKVYNSAVKISYFIEIIYLEII